MRVIACAAATAAALLAGTVASGSAATFAVVPSTTTTLPSAEVPNTAGSITLPAAFTTPPPYPEQRSSGELRSLWHRAAAAYGIPWEVLAAINKIESNFGRNMGPSSAGAVGWMQFMPSTWLRWGLDADGDGLANPWTPEDAIFAAARYLAAAGGRTDLKRGIFAYNHADWYVQDVLELARLYGRGGTGTAFALDGLEQRIDGAQQGVVAAADVFSRASALEQRLARTEQRLRSLIAATRVLSERLELQKQLFEIESRRLEAERALERAQTGLEAQQALLAGARDSSTLASFDPAAGALLGAASADGEYVFPVGGGPSAVSVAHTHHDYPAADIAAPEGSPVYALADAAVIAAWPAPNGNCGIGAMIATSDGQRWTYCHLSVLESSVRPGAALRAGAPLGLVGMTGRTTGPHLHLQLSPTSSYPQAQPWFERFAGVAFRWQDAPTPTAPAPFASPVFAVVSDASIPGDVIAFTR